MRCIAPAIKRLIIYTVHGRKSRWGPFTLAAVVATDVVDIVATVAPLAGVEDCCTIASSELFDPTFAGFISIVVSVGTEPLLRNQYID